MILENVGELQRAHSAVLAAARESSALETTKAFATHPANRDRIASAARERAPGLFQTEAPATVLFQDFDRIAREVTLAFYKSVIGPEVEPKNLIPTARLVAEHADRVEGHRVLRRYLQGDVSSEYRLFLGALDLSQSIEPSQTRDQLRAARTRMLEALPRYQEALRAFLEADRDRDRAEIVATRMAGGIRDDASGLKLSEVGHAAARQAQEALGAARAERLRDLDAAARPIIDRMRSAFPLLSSPEVAAQVGDVAAAHCGKLLDAREALHRAWPHIENLRLKMALVGTLFNDLNNNKENVSLVTQIKSIASQIMVLLRDTAHHSGLRAIPLRTWQRNGQHRHGFRSDGSWTGGIRRAFRRGTGPDRQVLLTRLSSVERTHRPRRANRDGHRARAARRSPGDSFDLNQSSRGGE